jgi:hypothetical protein
MTNRIQRSIERAAIAAGLVLAIGALAPLASDAQMNPMMKEQLDRMPTGEEGVKQILAPMTERLQLTDDQLTEVRPIVEGLVADMASARSKLETGETTIMKFMMEMNMQGEAAATQIEQHLTETQLAEYAAMREEQKMRMMEERRKAMQAMMKARQEAAAASAGE